jgi:hypothetical protein
MENRPDRAERITRAWKILAAARPDVILAAARALSVGAPDMIPPELIDLGSRIIRAGGS